MSAIACTPYCPPGCIHAHTVTTCSTWCPPMCVHAACTITRTVTVTTHHHGDCHSDCPPDGTDTTSRTVRRMASGVILTGDDYCRIHDLYACPYAHGPSPVRDASCGWNHGDHCPCTV
jgi:hypothetical protein